MVILLKRGLKVLNAFSRYKGYINNNQNHYHLRTFPKPYCTVSNKDYEINLKLNNVSLNNYIYKITKEYDTLCKNGDFTNSPRRLEIQPIIKILNERDDIISNINNIQELLEDEDKEIRQLAEEERSNFEAKIKDLDVHLLNVLLFAHQEDNLNNSIVLEVQAGVGGQEAMLFAKELFNMYCNFAEHKGWQVEIAEYLETEIGGIRFASALIDGHLAFRFFKHEAGVHRVQRIPATEKAGRIHTSTVSVVALPQPTDIEVNLQQKDLKIETKRSTGAGGQHVNTTDSAVRMTHIPTGISVECQTDRSQIKNRKFALARIRALLFQRELDAQAAESEAFRKSQVRSNNRNEKIRTYNFNQDRITDHRLQAVHFHNLEVFMNGGEDLERLINLLDYQDKVDSLLQKVENSTKDLVEKSRIQNRGTIK